MTMNDDDDIDNNDIVDYIYLNNGDIHSSLAIGIKQT